MKSQQVIVSDQAWGLSMEKSAEKWGPGGLLRPPVGIKGAMPPVGVRGLRPLTLKLFNKKNKT